MQCNISFMTGGEHAKTAAIRLSIFGASPKNLSIYPIDRGGGGYLVDGWKKISAGISKAIACTATQAVLSTVKCYPLTGHHQ
jgi:hypothetical protein